MAERFTREELDRIISTYLDALKGKISINKAILFGSYAKNTAHQDSDIDLLIISNDLSPKSPKGANGFILDNLAGYSNIDTSLEVIGIHPDKLNGSTNQNFIDEIIDSGIEIKL